MEPSDWDSAPRWRRRRELSSLLYAWPGASSANWGRDGPAGTDAAVQSEDSRRGSELKNRLCSSWPSQIRSPQEATAGASKSHTAEKGHGRKMASRRDT